jgi:GMP synthase-like glutamine amidotransferase
LLHVPFEDSANIGVWAASRGHTLTETRLWDNDPLPAIDSFDWLIVMGGLMNVYETDAYPWLIDEKAFLRTVIDRGTPVLGVCLGAQLAADALGGKVTRNPQKEIGWFPVSLTNEARESPFFRDLPQQFTAFQWHGDTFAIPPGAVRLAENDVCPNQAFQYGDHVVGLQFHIEYSARSIEKMIDNCGDELIESPFIQRPEQMLPRTAEIEAATEQLHRILEAMEATVR